MSRSRHTDPRDIRADRRAANPGAPRGEGDISDERSLAGALKCLGITAEAGMGNSSSRNNVYIPRIRVSKPRPEFSHPAGKADVRALLEWLGPECRYGLRSVELVRGSESASAAVIRFGQLQVPGRILLYEQPVGDWMVSGQIPHEDAERIAAAGAIISEFRGGADTRIHWPGDTLRQFMLLEVLTHEVGHHLIQQYKGKRTARVARTRDHEAAARNFARRCREAFAASGDTFL